MAAAGFFLVVITDAGEAYGLGYDRGRGYHTHLDHCKERQPPYKIDIKGCTKALRCWSMKNTSVVFILGEDSSGMKKTWSGSEFLDHYESGMIYAYGRGEFRQNYGHTDNRAPFELMKVPDGIFFKKVAGCGGSHMWALDQTGTPWKWGYQMRDYSHPENDSTDPWAEPYVNNQTPRKILYFAKKGLKVIDICPGDQFCIMRCKDGNGMHSLYIIFNPDYEYQHKNLFGPDVKKVKGNVIYTLPGIDSGRVQAMDAGHYMFVWINKAVDNLKSMIPEQPDVEGWTHVYMDEEGEYKYLSQQEYE